MGMSWVKYVNALCSVWVCSWWSPDLGGTNDFTFLHKPTLLAQFTVKYSQRTSSNTHFQPKAVALGTVSTVNLSTRKTFYCWSLIYTRIHLSNHAKYFIRWTHHESCSGAQLICFLWRVDASSIFREPVFPHTNTSLKQPALATTAKFLKLLLQYLWLGSFCFVSVLVWEA